ncbi:hypothetical protein [Candidatus Odyssella thessalonicensis]|uniref:hypothetical protein n=1 Tax=Candidatus Odyssella thessalonicensis TaxID=84647 RepID=UPI000225B500|nr:hypothetical protein [Candidatus Odyssella thessalonicensis]
MRESLISKVVMTSVIIIGIGTLFNELALPPLYSMYTAEPLKSSSNNSLNSTESKIVITEKTIHDLACFQMGLSLKTHSPLMLKSASYKKLCGEH